MTETFDIAIVGAGITGCAIARQLARFDLSICVVEAANDIALGASKANGGLVHAGYDPAPGTVKAQVNARGCELYGTWSQELGFLFCRTGSMVLGFNDEDSAHMGAAAPEWPGQRRTRAGDRRTRPHPRIRVARQCRCNVRVVVPLDWVYRPV